MNSYDLAKLACRAKQVSLVRSESLRLLVFCLQLSESCSLSHHAYEKLNKPRLSEPVSLSPRQFSVLKSVHALSDSHEPTR